MTDGYPITVCECGHNAAQHALEQRDDLPATLRSAPCAVTDCHCRDYDGLEHPQRPSLADTTIWRGDDGRVHVAAGDEAP